MFFRKKIFSKRGQDGSGASEPTIISRDMTIEGNLFSDGEVHVDGTVIGSVRAAVCVIEATGSVTGGVTADALYIHGQINGPVDAGHVRIYAGSQVKGDVLNETISIEDGAYIHGSIRHGRSGNGAALTSGQPSANPFEASAPNSNQPNGANLEDVRPIKVVRPRG